MVEKASFGVKYAQNFYSSDTGFLKHLVGELLSGNGVRDIVTYPRNDNTDEVYRADPTNSVTNAEKDKSNSREG